MANTASQSGLSPVANAGVAFISYARDDDGKPPFDDATQGWVTFFWHQLRWELTDLGAKQAKLWLDRYEIEPEEEFTEIIEMVVRNATVIIPIFSKNWVQRDWCKKEVNFFVEAHPDATKRIVPIFKNKVDYSKLPPIMQRELAREGYRFFTQDDTGRVNEFYWRGLKDQNAYFSLLRDIAQSIIRCLGEKQVLRSAPATPSTGQTVFLAYATQALVDARQRLKNDLTKAGVNVVPTSDDAPDTVEALESVIGEALGQAELEVHFIGDKHDATPEGSEKPLLDLQLRLAREVASSTSTLRPRILWAPRWLPDRPQDKRDPFQVVDGFGGLQRGEELYGEEVTDLSLWLRKRLEPSPPPVDRPKPDRQVIVASAQAVDDELATDLANYAQGTLPHVRPWFSDEPWSAVATEAVLLILWGRASVAEIDALLAKRPANALTLCLKLPGGDQLAKRRFFRPGVDARGIDSLPANRKQAQEFFERLELVQSGETRP